MASFPKMNREFSIFIVGEPAPQGSKRHVGNGVMIEASKKVKPWRKAVADQIGKAFAIQGEVKFEGAIELEQVFILKRPTSVKRLLPTVPPDLDKLERGLWDALTLARIWTDDSLVVVSRSSKLYAKNGEPTGVFVYIREVSK
jgi:crossover junction endodeoxyribonuclease RusA